MQEDRIKNIREIQIAEIELIRLFVDICEKEHLMYYMLGGTMLGAIRHKGYIPWDDDADFGLPRQDYEKFFKVASKYLTKGIHLSTYNGENHCFYIGQLLNEKKKVRIGKVLNTHEVHISIDIFPLDGMPETSVCRGIHKVRLLLLRKLFLLSNFEMIVPLADSHRAWYNRFGVRLCRYIPIYKLIPKQRAWQWIDKALRSYPYDSSTWNLNMMGAYKFRELFPKSVFGEGELYDFEGMKLRGPKDYETYLTQLYGDYMTPPPESEWNKHNTEFVEE